MSGTPAISPLTTSSNLRTNRHEPPRKSRFHEPRCQTDVAILKHRTRRGDSTGAPRHHSAAFDHRPAGQQCPSPAAVGAMFLDLGPNPVRATTALRRRRQMRFPASRVWQKNRTKGAWQSTAGPPARQDTLIIPIIRLDLRPATIFFFPRGGPRPKSSSSSPNSRCADHFPGVISTRP